MLVQLLSVTLLFASTGLPSASTASFLGSSVGSKGAVAPAPDSVSELALAAGRAAVKRGDPERAREHFQRALASEATRPDAALELAVLAKEGGNADYLATAALHYAEATVDLRGGVRSAPRGAWTAPEGETDFGPIAKRAAAARVKLAEALVSLAKEREAKGARAPEGLLTAAWARRFALDLVQRTPVAGKLMAPALKTSVSIPKGAHGPVLKALDRLSARALATGDLGTTIRAARILHGLGVQADFKDLQGDRPSGMASWRSKGADMLRKARERQAERSEEPWTVEDLEWLSGEEGESFTRGHSSFAEPGVAVSPRGYYRIESDCGYETLLAVATTIEDHHVRLANYFGSDPFVKNGTKVERQGTIRIVPDPNGLEAEGAPFFWAGGFQSGDTTVVRLAAGTVDGLGRTLTHELTHRFDGALHRGIPAWLAEGRAVWTGAAYGRSTETEFVSDFCLFGGMVNVLNRGLNRGRRLEAILMGTPEDYRSNYTAGLALYVFLSTYFPGDAPSMSDGTPMFRELLHGYENEGKHPAKPKDVYEEFVDHFCDGEDGRPDSIEEFEDIFTEFLEGFIPRKLAPFTKRYVPRIDYRGAGTWIYDEPTWTWDWVRAEPSFGQNQARVAGELLLENGQLPEAIRAFVWARAVDGYDKRIAAGLVDAIGGTKSPSRTQTEALWAVHHERNAEPFASRVSVDSARKRLTEFPGKLKAVDTCLKELHSVAVDLAAADARGSAMRVFGDLERIAAWAGKPAPTPMELNGIAPIPAGESEELVGWADETLTRLDDDRAPGLFFVEEDGTVLLGRKTARTGSGRFDRTGGGRSFVRATRWMLPGTYRIKTRVNFTTAHGTVIVVLGWMTRDRNLRLRLTAGDRDYASGESEKEPKFDKVRWRFNGMRTREGGLATSVTGGTIELQPAGASVELELVVTGPVVNAWIAGKFAGSYHTVDGAPIEGYVGFGTASGSAAVASPIVTREDRRPVENLDLERGTAPEFSRLANLSVFFGDLMEPLTNGALVLWIPADSKSISLDPGSKDAEGAPARALTRARRSAVQLLDRMARNGVAQPLVVALPEDFKEHLDRDAFEGALRDASHESGVPPRIIFHRIRSAEVSDNDDKPLARFKSGDRGRRWIFFVDGASVVRMSQPFTSAAAISQDMLEHWLTVFRDYGQPERKLPEFSRPAPEPEDDAEEGDD